MVITFSSLLFLFRGLEGPFTTSLKSGRPDTKTSRAWSKQGIRRHASMVAVCVEVSILARLRLTLSRSQTDARHHVFRNFFGVVDPSGRRRSVFVRRFFCASGFLVLLKRKMMFTCYKFFLCNFCSRWTTVC